MPFNLNSIAALFPPYLADLLCKKLISSYGFGKKVPILRLRETDDTDLRFLADYIYEHVFETYTMKQWALRPEDLDPGVTARVPVYISRDDRYFQDTYQAMPKEGYTKLFERMMEHHKIQILLNAEYKAVRLQYPHSKVVYTGPIDEYFDYAHGPLPYRGMKFVSDYKSVERAQTAGTVNFPNDFDFTRITEMKWLTGQTTPATVLIEEYPEAYEPGKNEPYYPIPTLENAEKLRPYQALA